MADTCLGPDNNAEKIRTAFVLEQDPREGGVPKGAMDGSEFEAKHGAAFNAPSSDEHHWGLEVNQEFVRCSIDVPVAA